jgi:putative hemolysin
MKATIYTRFKKAFATFLGLILLGPVILVACTMEPTPLGSPVPTPTATLSSLALANPAAANCLQKGFRDQIRTDASGNQSGVCIFNDGSFCDDWAYLRGECGPGTPTPNPSLQPSPQPTAESTPVPTPMVILTPLGNETLVVDAARLALASRINVQISDVKLSKLESVTWKDSCLELADPTEACTLVSTPGFRITLVAGTASFVFHTDLAGANIRLESNSAGTH